MNGIHLCPVVRGKSLEVSIHPSLKDSPVFDLGGGAFSWLELYFAFQIDVSLKCYNKVVTGVANEV